MGHASRKLRVFRDQQGSTAVYAPRRLPTAHSVTGVRLDTVSLHCTMDAQGVGRRLGSPLTELSDMAIDQRETRLDDVWRNRPACVALAYIGKPDHLIGCVAESH